MVDSSGVSAGLTVSGALRIPQASAKCSSDLHLTAARQGCSPGAVGKTCTGNALGGLRFRSGLDSICGWQLFAACVTAGFPATPGAGPPAWFLCSPSADGSKPVQAWANQDTHTHLGTGLAHARVPRPTTFPAPFRSGEHLNFSASSGHLDTLFEPGPLLTLPCQSATAWGLARRCRLKLHTACTTRLGVPGKWRRVETPGGVALAAWWMKREPHLARDLGAFSLAHALYLSCRSDEKELKKQLAALQQRCVSQKPALDVFVQAQRFTRPSAPLRLAEAEEQHRLALGAKDAQLAKLTSKIQGRKSARRGQKDALQAIMRQREARLRAAGVDASGATASATRDATSPWPGEDDAASVALSVAATLPAGRVGMHARGGSTGSVSSALSVPSSVDSPAATVTVPEEAAVGSAPPSSSTGTSPASPSHTSERDASEPPAGRQAVADAAGQPGAGRGSRTQSVAEQRRARALSDAPAANPGSVGIGRVFVWGRVAALRQCDRYLASGEVPDVCRGPAGGAGGRLAAPAPVRVKAGEGPAPRRRRHTTSASTAAARRRTGGGAAHPWSASPPCVYPVPLTGTPFLQPGVTAGAGAPQMPASDPLALLQYVPTPRLSLRQVSGGRGGALLLSDDGDVFEWCVADDQVSHISDVGCGATAANSWTLRVPRLLHCLSLHRAITGARVVCVSAGPQHALALLDDGVVMSWGSTDDGRLGHGPLDALDLEGIPTLVQHQTDVAGGPASPASATPRYNPGCLSLFSSGLSDLVQTPVLPPEPAVLRRRRQGRAGSSLPAQRLADPGKAPLATECMPRPVQALLGRRVVQVAAGGAHSAAVTLEGEVWTWGRGRQGRLGHGDTRSQHTPKLVRGSGVVKGDGEGGGGTLFSWLFGGPKAAAIDPATSFDPLQAMSAGRDALGVGMAGKWKGVRVTRVVCGRAFTLAITAQGEVWTWGSSEEGQCGVGLGRGPASDILTPTLVPLPPPPAPPAVAVPLPLAAMPSPLSQGAQAASQAVPGLERSGDHHGSSTRGHGECDARGLADAAPSPGRGPTATRARSGSAPASPRHPPATSLPDRPRPRPISPPPVPPAQAGPGGATALATPPRVPRGAGDTTGSTLDSSFTGASRRRSSSLPRSGGGLADSSLMLSPISVASSVAQGGAVSPRGAEPDSHTSQYLRFMGQQWEEDSVDSAPRPGAGASVRLQPIAARQHTRTFVVAAAAGHAHALVLTLDGRVFGWGNNNHGQVGSRAKPWFQASGPRKGGRAASDGRFPVQPVPVEVPLHPLLQYGAPSDAPQPWDRITSITAGDWHSMAGTWRGRVFAWGSNNSAELGSGHTSATHRIVEVGRTVPSHGAQAKQPSASAKPSAAGAGAGEAPRPPDPQRRRTPWVGCRLMAAGKDFSLILEGSRKHLVPFSRRATRARSSSEAPLSHSGTPGGTPDKARGAGVAAEDALAGDRPGDIGIAWSRGSAASDPGSLPYCLAVLSPVQAASAGHHMQRAMAYMLDNAMPTRFAGQDRIPLNMGRLPGDMLAQHQAALEAEERRGCAATRRWMRMVNNFGPQRTLPATLALATQGIPPSLRASIWPTALGNRLRITPETFAAACVRAQAVLTSVTPVGSATHRPFPVPSSRPAHPGSVSTRERSATATEAPSSSGLALHRSASVGMASSGSPVDLTGSTVSPSPDIPDMPGGASLEALLRMKLPVEVREAVESAVANLARARGGGATELPTSETQPLVRPFGKEATVTLIDTDLKRVYPAQRLFAIDDLPGPLHRQLALVLYAASVTRPDLGYVQGMAYVAGMLVAHIPDPYVAYQSLLNMVTTDHMYAFLSMDRSLLERFYRLFFSILKAVEPQTGKVFATRVAEVHPDLYLLPWFQTIFTKVLPFRVCARVWDRYLLEGLPALVQAAIALLKGVALQVSQGGLDEMLAIITSAKHPAWVAVTAEDAFLRSMGGITLTQQHRGWLATFGEDPFFYQGTALARTLRRRG